MVLIILIQQCPSSYLCTEDEVFDLLTSLDSSKSTGPDGVSAKMLKETATSITYSLTKLFTQSISKGVFPSDWKIARTVPIPKSADKSLPKNYRPISTSTSSQVAGETYPHTNPWSPDLIPSHLSATVWLHDGEIYHFCSTHCHTRNTVLVYGTPTLLRMWTCWKAYNLHLRSQAMDFTLWWIVHIC